MKRILMTMALCVVSISALMAQTKVNDKTTIYDLNQSKLHVYQTGDAMGDVSFIIEGEKSLVILEQPLFWDNIKEFNSYVESLKKPIDKVVANYHSLGLADYPSNKIVMPKEMISFGKSDMAKGMISKFEKGFGEAADFRPHKKAKGFDVPSTQTWGGVELAFTAGVASDFPAASILIDGKAYYVHFSPSRTHVAPMRIKSRESVDQILAELNAIKESKAQYIFGSHGKPASQKDVAFQIKYFKTIKSLLKQCKDADMFSQRLMIAYPSIAGVENVKAISKALYPDESVDTAKEEIRGRLQDYLKLVSTLDMNIAKGLWAAGDNISIIAPRGHFYGYNNITKNFLIKNFSKMKFRELSSVSEVINVYGTSATVQLYWRFETVDEKDKKHIGYGRESLIFQKIKGEWRLVHVHYSQMPSTKK